MSLQLSQSSGQSNTPPPNLPSQLPHTFLSYLPVNFTHQQTLHISHGNLSHSSSLFLLLLINRLPPLTDPHILHKPFWSPHSAQAFVGCLARLSTNVNFLHLMQATFFLLSYTCKRAPFRPTVHPLSSHLPSTHPRIIILLKPQHPTLTTLPSFALHIMRSFRTALLIVNSISFQLTHFPTGG